jgi:predicted methyltransferase family protein/methyltransferase family protein/protein-lysine methyltransferase-like protein
MGALRVDPYDVYPYSGATVPYTAPAHLALCARWSGHTSSDVERFGAAELGCGDGGNLLPLAFHNPHSTFVGIDSSQSALKRAQDGADRLALRNVGFVCSDIRSLRQTTLGPFDYIIAHGLYSWVSEDVRTATLAFCRDNLAVDGLAYISYNAQPGWATRQLVRDTVRRSPSVRAANLPDKASIAIELATALLQDLPSSRFASAMLLRDELSRLRDGRASYVFHEYLTDINDGFWLRDFVDRARDHSLVYVVDAHRYRWEGYVSPDLRTAVSERKLDPVVEEETLDLLGHRYFRASILARTHTGRTPMSHHDLIESLHIASSLQPQSDSLDLDEGEVERFVGAGGREVTLDSSIGKAAIILLRDEWPRGIRFESLYAQSLARLVEHGRAAPPAARGELLEAIELLFEAGQVDLRLDEPLYTSRIGEYPAAHALARWEAETREALTTPHHLTVAFDRDTLSLVRLMDGSRSRAQLHEMFGSEFIERTLPILGRCGLLEDLARRSSHDLMTVEQDSMSIRSGPRGLR